MTSPGPAVAVPRDQIMSLQELEKLLEKDVVAVRVLEKSTTPTSGALVGVRLNLNLMKTTGKAIQTLHLGTNHLGYRRNKGFYKGEACGYAQAVRLKNAYFNVSQGGREAIATGQQNKFPMASVDGEFVSTEIPDDFEGVEIRFNPKAHHLFVDGNDQGVHSAEDVIVLGSRVYARGKVTYHTEISAPKRAGDAPSATKLFPAVSPIAALIRARVATI